jgi:hypothetical protein
MVDHDGMFFFSHKEKEHILSDYYRDILGNSVATQEFIDLEEVYPTQIDLSTLTQPFSEDEILNVLKLIPRDESPGPDGFGSRFYQDFWSLIKPDILTLFQHFFKDRLQMDRNNRSYIVLIKKEGSCAPSDYRPISLLNCSVKLITKALALRLQSCLNSLIDLDQFGFIRSRSISDSFIYALEVLETCKIRNKKDVVLKLDFRKAFDMVSWDCLLRILQVRGFNRKWCNWIHLLSSSAKTAILLNGIPGLWIQIKRGLRQGDPLSPLLFLIIVDILQHTIQHFSREGALKHPIVSNLPCPIIQYVDDMLIIF